MTSENIEIGIEACAYYEQLSSSESTGSSKNSSDDLDSGDATKSSQSDDNGITKSSQSDDSGIAKSNNQSDASPKLANVAAITEKARIKFDFLVVILVETIWHRLNENHSDCLCNKS